MHRGQRGVVSCPVDIIPWSTVYFHLSCTLKPGMVPDKIVPDKLVPDKMVPSHLEAFKAFWCKLSRLFTSPTLVGNRWHIFMYLLCFIIIFFMLAALAGIWPVRHTAFWHRPVGMNVGVKDPAREGSEALRMRKRVLI